MPWSKTKGWNRGSWNAGQAAGSPNTALFVGAASFSSTGTGAQDIDLSSLSPQAGDLVLIQGYGTVTTMTATGLGSGAAFAVALAGAQSSFRWDEATTNSDGTNRVKYYSKVWDANDVSGGGTPANAQKIRFANSNSFGGALILIYRGPTTVSIPNLPSYFNGGTTSLSVAGLTPDPLSWGVAVLCMTRTTTAGACTPSSSGFVTRASAVAFSVGELGAMDKLNGYAGGAIPATFAGSVNPVIGVAVELK
jgi:hypothetical protein